MNVLTSDPKSLYFRYLSAAFGSAFISSIYGVVDSAMVGQYQGPEGTAALAIVAPIWNIIYSLGLLMGIGGSVLFSLEKAKSDSQDKANQWYTCSVIGLAVIAIIVWLALIFIDTPILQAFGAQDNLMNLAKQYLFPVKFFVPTFLFTQLYSAYLRNDNVPALATKATLFGGIFNVVGDYVFIFVFNMGIMGAGLATLLGNFFSLTIMLSHLKNQSCTLKFVKVSRFFHRIRKIMLTGFSTFFIDVAMGILTILFNRQILAFLGTNALSVYGIVINISTFVQCSAYSIGQASQPLISMNLGAGQGSRIRQILKYCLITAAVFGVLWYMIAVLFPDELVRIFMTPTTDILSIAPHIIGVYGLSFLLLPFNIYSTYYFQALMKPKMSMVVSVGRGALLSGCLILILPVVFGPDSLWWAMPITELVIAIIVVKYMIQYTKELPVS